MLIYPGTNMPPIILPDPHDEDGEDLPNWKDASIGEKIYMVLMYGGLGILGIGVLVLLCLTIKVVIENI